MAFSHWPTLVRIASAGFSVALTLLLSLLLSQATFGLFSLYQAIAGLLLVIVSCGTVPALIRAARATGIGAVSQYLERIALPKALQNGLISMAVIVPLGFLLYGTKAERSSYLIVLLFGLVAGTINGIQKCIAVASRYFVPSAFAAAIEVAVRPSITLLIVASILAFTEVNLLAVLIASLFGSVAALGTAGFTVYGNRRFLQVRRTTMEPISDGLAALSIEQVVSFFGARIELLIASVLLSPADLAEIGFVVLLNNLLLLPQQSINQQLTTLLVGEKRLTKALVAAARQAASKAAALTAVFGAVLIIVSLYGEWVWHGKFEFTHELTWIVVLSAILTVYIGPNNFIFKAFYPAQTVLTTTLWIRSANVLIATVMGLMYGLAGLFVSMLLNQLYVNLHYYFRIWISVRDESSRTMG